MFRWYLACVTTACLVGLLRPSAGDYSMVVLWVLFMVGLTTAKRLWPVVGMLTVGGLSVGASLVGGYLLGTMSVLIVVMLLLWPWKSPNGWFRNASAAVAASSGQLPSPADTSPIT